VENAKMGKYDQSDFNQAQTAAIVAKADEVVDLIEVVGVNFMGKIDNKLFSADKAIRERAIVDGGIEKGDEAFAAATQLGSIMARLMAVERKSFGGTAITDTELEALAPMLADMNDQPASAAIKISELANAALDKHNLYRQKEGLPVFTDPDQILNNEDKEELYRDYISDRFPPEAKIDPVGTGKSNTVDASDWVGDITGLDGSKFNSDGLDYVISGENRGFDAPIPSPSGGTVTRIVSGFTGDPDNASEGDFSENDGYGNQVEVTFPDGRVMVMSHLNSIGDLVEGQEIEKGFILGKQGNTGNTYSNSGGNGAHLDIAMTDAEGNKIPPNKIAQILKLIG
jgi:murein DD-endopeptidase MepM/ murein hydrolase activator NlpD